MNLNRIIHPIVNIPDTDETQYDQYGRVAYFKKDGKWQLKTHKDLKKTTHIDLPRFTKGDLVKVDGKSLYGVPVKGEFIFDSWDSWDNTCFISTDKSGSMCYWMSLTEIELIK